MNDLKVGDSCIVFDCDTWSKVGDIGDNSFFYKEGRIINVRVSENEHQPAAIIDVQFKDGRISRAHFKSLVKPNNNE